MKRLSLHSFLVLSIIAFSGCYKNTNPLAYTCSKDRGCPSGYTCQIKSGELFGKCCKSDASNCGLTDASTKNDALTFDVNPLLDLLKFTDGEAPSDAQPFPDVPQAQVEGGSPTSPPEVLVDERLDALVPPPPIDITKTKSGEPCTIGGDCQSGVCVDKICCDSLCDKACFSCKQSLTGKADGACAPVSSGKKDGLNSCIDETAKNQCGNDGFCDGAGACRKVGTDHVCTPSSCTGENSSTFSPTQTCDGKGECKPPAPTICGTAGCDKIDGCKKICKEHTECSANAFCNVDIGKCSEKKIDGESCKDLAECQSKICVHGVCCGTACTEKCKACSKAFNGQKSGTCLPVQVGTDPLDSCADEPGCGNDGSCDGAGDCLKRGADTICSPALCSIDNKFSFPAGCNGKGVCQTPKVQDCLSITCDSKVGCPSKCTVDTNCEAGNYCNDGTCTSKQGPGKPCTAINQCASGNCVEGVCCNEKCDGACYSCKKILNDKPADGTCAVVVSGQKDTKSSCDDTRDSTKGCGQDGTCDGNGGCRKAGKGTNCGPAICNATGDFVAASTCNGLGFCVTPLADDCKEYPCATSGCQTSCTTDKECSGSTYCAKPYCVAKLDPGDPCGANNNACDSGNCVSGVCCRTPCSKSAESTCGYDGTCDSSGYCKKYDSTIQCFGPKCSGSSFSSASYCNGTGTCIDRVTSCGNFKCSLSGCNLSCSIDGECNAGRCSINNLCETCGTSTKPCCKASPTCGSGLTCDGEKCVLLKPNGETCTANTQCNSGSCMDSSGTKRCCPSDCTSSVSNCRIGGCNASGACLPAGSGTECRSRTCANGSEAKVGVYGIGQYAAPAVTIGLCNGNTGAASCVTQTQTCTGGNACETNGSKCASYCAKDVDCATGYYCAAGTNGGVCTLRKTNNIPCQEDRECNSRVCSYYGCKECQVNDHCPRNKPICNDDTCISCLVWYEGSPGNCNSDGSLGPLSENCGTRSINVNFNAWSCKCGAANECPVGMICDISGGLTNGVCKIRAGQPCLVATSCNGGVMCSTSGGVCPSTGVLSSCVENFDRPYPSGCLESLVCGRDAQRPFFHCRTGW